jgi:hypothetical protein
MDSDDDNRIGYRKKTNNPTAPKKDEARILHGKGANAGN